MDEMHSPQSPRWGAMTKLVFALSGVALLGFLLVRFQGILAPVLMAVVVAYLLLPFAAFIERRTPLSWTLTVDVIYLILVILLIGLITWGGVGLVQQIQSLIGTIQDTIKNLPDIINSLSGKVYHIGPFLLDLSKINWSSFGQQVLSYIQPVLGRLGNLVASLAGSAAATLGWTAFVVLVSYFFLLESGGLRGRIIPLEIPGYSEDIHRLNDRLGHIWNAFLRGQMVIFLSSSVAYTLLFSILGMRFAIGLGLLAGFASFLPYVGPAISWIAIALVTYFQGANPFSLPPLAYAALAVVVAVVIHQVFDMLATVFMAQTLKVHPAIVLIGTIIAADLFGLLGIIIAAPLVATLGLFGQYVLRKMFDRDPWAAREEIHRAPPRLPRLTGIKKWWQARRKKIT